MVAFDGPAAHTLHRPIIEFFLHRNVWAKGVEQGLTCTPGVFIPFVHAFHAYFSETCLLSYAYNHVCIQCTFLWLLHVRREPGDKA